jgi:hypothetical protein
VKKSHNRILIILIILFPVLFIFQGLDLTDTGFHLTKVSNFMKQESGGIVWFSFFIGYIWDLVFGQWGLTGFKLLSYILFELTIWTVFFGLSRIFPRKYLLLYVFLGMMMTLSIKTFFFSYDNLSNLFLVLGGTLVLVGVTTDSRMKIGGAGFVFALSTFSRLPDIVSLAMIGLFPFYEFLKNYRFSDVWTSRLAWLRSTGIFLAGFGLGVVLVLVLLRMFGHTDRVLESVVETLNIFADSGGDSGHSASGMFTRQLESGKRMFNSALLFLLIFLLFAWLIQHKDRLKLIGYYTIAVAGTAAFIFIRTDHHYFVNYVNIITGAQIALALIFFLPLFSVDTRYRFALLCGIAVMIASYMGSDTGLLKSSTGWFITIPVLFLFFDAAGDLKLSAELSSGPRLMTISSRRMKNFLIYLILLTSLMIRYVAVFGDEGSRHRMVQPVDIPLARGTLTTPEKARHVRMIYDDLREYVGEDDYLIGHGGGPLFIYLTGARFYIPSTWILWYSTSAILPDLNTAYGIHQQLPVILMVDEALFRTVYEEEIPVIDEQRGEIHRFMDQFLYTPVISRENYEIWVPAEGP